MQAAVGVSDVMIARELTVQTQQIFRSPFYRKRFITKIKILKKFSETLNNNLRRPTAMEEKNSA